MIHVGKKDTFFEEDYRVYCTIPIKESHRWEEYAEVVLSRLRDRVLSDIQAAVVADRYSAAEEIE